MQTSRTPSSLSGPAVIGGLLVFAGIAALLLRQAGIDLAEAVGEGGWPVLVIGPGVLLIAAASLVRAPGGVGFAIAGSIVTTVGLILLYQNTTKDWESWAYAWALIPTAAGVANIVYGVATRHHELVTVGTRVAAVGAVLFVIGMWFFGAVFETGRAPFDLETWWPLVAVAVGIGVILSAFVAGGSRPSGTPPTGADGRSTPTP